MSRNSFLADNGCYTTFLYCTEHRSGVCSGTVVPCEEEEARGGRPESHVGVDR
jgi:hypothetical protein